MRHGNTPYLALGTYRLFLALAVFLQHAQYIFPSRAFVPYGAELGRMALVSFFVIGGWVNAQSQMTYQDRPWTFLAARFLRLYPAFLLALTMAIMIEWLVPRFAPPSPQHLTLFAPANLLANLGSPLPFLSTLVERAVGHPPYDALPVAWSLRVFFTYYALLTVGLWLRQRRLSIKTKNAMWLILSGALLASFGLPLPDSLASLVAYVPAFVLGHCLFLRQERPQPWQGPVMVVAVLALLLRLNLFDISGFLPIAQTSLLWRPAGLLQMAFLFSCLAPLWFVANLKLRAPWMAIDRYLGALSFPLFLLHFPLLRLAYRTIGGQGWLAILAAFAATCFLAVLEERFVERPLARWRQRRLLRA